MGELSDGFPEDFECWDNAPNCGSSLDPIVAVSLTRLTSHDPSSPLPSTSAARSTSRSYSQGGYAVTLPWIPSPTRTLCAECATRQPSARAKYRRYRMSLFMSKFLKVMETRVGPREYVGRNLDDLISKEPRLQAVGRKTFFDLLNCPEGESDLSKSSGLVSLQPDTIKVKFI